MENINKRRQKEMSQYYLAVDIGTSSGRHMLACIQDEKN